MGSVFLCVVDLMTSFGWLTNRVRSVRRRRASVLQHAQVRQGRTTRSAISNRAPPLPVRVIWPSDPTRTDGRTTRVIVSGHIDDVCAELERLAALEEAMQGPTEASRLAQSH